MSEDVRPYSDSTQQKKMQVRRMFNNIARRYDFLNHFLSLGVDIYWRRRAISLLKKHRPVIILDVATGTGDLALEALKLKPQKIFGIDLSEDMLEIGRQKIKKRKADDVIQLLEGDSENLIFEDNKFDAITVGFGVRNFENLVQGLREMHRVLKPGGIACILEFSRPGNKIIRSIYDFYSSSVAPSIGKFFSKDKEAYLYLHRSVRAFPSGKEFTAVLESAGFKEAGFRTLTFGIATLYHAKK